MLADYAEIIERREVHAALCDDEVVGVIVLARTSEGFCLDNIAVRPGSQGKGSVGCSYSWPSRRQLAKALTRSISTPTN